MEIVGFAFIKNNADKSKCQNPNGFIGEVCMVLEFGTDESVLVLDKKGTEIAIFNKEDVKTSFKCVLRNNIVFPPDLNLLDQFNYQLKCMNRKGGYDNILMNMVIMCSLHRGEFCDSFLWNKT